MKEKESLDLLKDKGFLHIKQGGLEACRWLNLCLYSQPLPCSDPLSLLSPRTSHTYKEEKKGKRSEAFSSFFVRFKVNVVARSQTNDSYIPPTFQDAEGQSAVIWVQ